MIQLSSIRLPLSAPREEALTKALRRLGIPRGKAARAEISKISVDGRRRPPELVYGVTVFLESEQEERALAQKTPGALFKRREELDMTLGDTPMEGRPVVCGLGPAGLFCALLLARCGFRPIVLERGPSVEERSRAAADFAAAGRLDPEANIQFGEGGAGAFSDGKLTTRIGDARCDFVTQVLLAHGAPPEIAFQQKPHIGTDLLTGVIASIRREICRLGGEVRFSTKLTGLAVQGGRLAGVETTAGPLAAPVLVLAVGHSARDTFAMLQAAGVPMEPKPFSVGFRIEHLQSEIDRALYHGAAGHPALGRGEYQLSHRQGDRGVYTFCMCPGGTVVAAASQEGGVVTNGMSYHARDGVNANAALVVSVLPEDIGGGAMEGIAFQRALEQAAFSAGGGGYAAPFQTVGAFLGGSGRMGRVQPTYQRGVREQPLAPLLPAPLTRALQAALPALGRKLPGFDAPDSLLTGLETRTSSPLRILRGEGLFCEALPGLYPCGEGAGYAGGIMSAAVDGVRVAQAIMARFCPP